MPELNMLPSFRDAFLTLKRENPKAALRAKSVIKSLQNGDKYGYRDQGDKHRRIFVDTHQEFQIIFSHFGNSILLEEIR